jgi:predicted secreted protein
MQATGRVTAPVRVPQGEEARRAHVGKCLAEVAEFILGNPYGTAIIKWEPPLSIYMELTRKRAFKQSS